MGVGSNHTASGGDDASAEQGHEPQMADVKQSRTA